jgi:hypothetical protein
MMLSQRPQDLVAKNNYTALNLLLRTNLERAHAVAAENFAKHPEALPIASTFAFSLLLRGWPAQGVEILSPFAAIALQRPTTALYYGLLLAAAGRETEARRYLDLAEQGSLLPEECALISDHPWSSPPCR